MKRAAEQHRMNYLCKQSTCTSRFELCKRMYTSFGTIKCEQRHTVECAVFRCAYGVSVSHLTPVLLANNSPLNSQNRLELTDFIWLRWTTAIVVLFSCSVFNVLPSVFLLHRIFFACTHLTPIWNNNNDECDWFLNVQFLKTKIILFKVGPN